MLNTSSGATHLDRQYKNTQSYILNPLQQTTSIAASYWVVVAVSVYLHMSVQSASADTPGETAQSKNQTSYKTYLILSSGFFFQL